MNTFEDIILIAACGCFGFWLALRPSDFQSLMAFMHRLMNSFGLNFGVRKNDFGVRPAFIRLFGVVYLFIFFTVIYMVLTGTQPNQNL